MTANTRQRKNYVGLQHAWKRRYGFNAQKCSDGKCRDTVASRQHFHCLGLGLQSWSSVFTVTVSVLVSRCLDTKTVQDTWQLRRRIT